MTKRTRIQDLAQSLDLPPRDVLRELLSAGVRTFHHYDGGLFLNLGFLHGWIRMRIEERWPDPVPELEFEMTAEVEAWLASLRAEQSVTTITVPIKQINHAAAGQPAGPLGDSN